MVLKTDDVHLVHAAQRGDVFAFEELVQRHRTRAYRVALRLLGDPVEAEDAAQDALLQAWVGLPEFRLESTFTTWLYGIVANRCLNVRRARRATQPLPEQMESRPSRSDELAESRASLRDLTRAIAALTPAQRGPFVLRELEALSYEEIADALGVTVPAVKGRIHRARLELAEAMGEWR